MIFCIIFCFLLIVVHGKRDNNNNNNGGIYLLSKGLFSVCNDFLLKKLCRVKQSEEENKKKLNLIKIKN